MIIGIQKVAVAGHSYSAWDKDKWVGSVSVRNGFNENGPTEAHQINFLYVEPEYRRKGIATGLIQQIIADYGKDHDLYLDVAPFETKESPLLDKEVIRAFYERLGFQPCTEGDQMYRYADKVFEAMGQ